MVRFSTKFPFCLQIYSLHIPWLRPGLEKSLVNRGDCLLHLLQLPSHYTSLKAVEVPLLEQ